MWLCCIVVLWVAAGSAQEALPWWKNALIYQVYPRSFKDTDGDGVGDLKGVTQNADYFKEIGLDAVWLSPIYKTPMIDFGYDISNFTMVDPLFGTMEDFEALAAKLRQLGIKLLMDFVPNHTSDQHEWFQKSVQSDPAYRDFFVWQDPKGWNGSTPIPPNNWLSLFGGSAWEWRQERNQFYLHQFSKQQPDLDFRNPDVVSNMTEIMNFWIDKGVDGFRIDAVKHIFENASFPDEPPVPGTAGDTFNSLQHIYTQDQPETYPLMDLWHTFVKNKDIADGRQRVMFVEVYDGHSYIMRYFNESKMIPFNFDLLSYGTPAARPALIKWIIDSWMNDMPPNGTPNWVVSNHDNERISDRYGTEMVDTINLLTGVLPGIKVVYYGDEIGMQDTYVRKDQVVDKSGVTLGPFTSRDPCRTPLQWDATPQAGFSPNLTTWLPVNPNYWWLNVAAQRVAQSSHLKVFQAMAKARKDPVLQRGDVSVLAPDNDTLVVVRYYNDSYFVLLINMGSAEYTYTSDNLFTPHRLDMDLEVVVGSLNCDYRSGLTMKRRKLSYVLRPKAAILLRTPASSSANSSGSRAALRPFLLCAILCLLRL